MNRLKWVDGIVNNYSVLIVSLSHNKRYWTKSHLVKMFDNLEKSSSHKLIALDSKNKELYKWIDSYKNMIPKRTSLLLCNKKPDSDPYFNIEESKKQELIAYMNKTYLNNYLGLEYKDMLNHLFESYIISCEIYYAYKPMYIYYYGRMDDEYIKLIFDKKYIKT